jgi:GT2 family glycosyltransferase/tetratricopeptide (TPR) repeat protein
MASLKSQKNEKQLDDFSSTEWLTNQAVARHKEGKLEEAIAFYLEVIELDSNQPAWVYGNVITLMAQVEPLDEGLELGNKALNIYPESDEIYCAIAILYEKQQDTSNCIQHYQKAIALDPIQPDWLYCNLAKQLLHNEQIAEAITVSYLGIQYYPNFYPLHYTLGEALMAESKWDQAISAYRRVQELNPNWSEIEPKLNQAIYRKNQAERLIYQQRYQTNLISQDDQPEISITLANSNEHLESPKQLKELDNIFTQLKNHKLRLAECQQIWQNFTGAKLNLNYGCWLSPSILYLEATVDDYWVLHQTDILACSQSHYAIAPGYFFQISEQQVAGVVCFENNVYVEDYGSYRFCVNNNNTPIFVAGEISQKAYSLEFIEYLKTKPDYQKHLIRESLSNSMIKLISEPQKPEAGNILKKLQYFLDFPPVNYVDPNLPFKIFIDYIIPLKSDGLFISGWLQDPYEMLEKITAISALGFALEFSNQDIHRLTRNDVNEFLQNTRYGNFEGKLGFCVYGSVPDTIRTSIQGFAELHSFRFLVRLKGNIEIEIIPDAKYCNFYNARQKVMRIASPDKVSESMLANCIAPAGLKLQQLCMEQVKIKDVSVIGTPVINPLVSLIIPLYRRLDFLKVQLATMANDPGIKQCEIIYVLDSPEQEDELRTLVLNHCILYQLTVKLVIMECNSGYAAANNAGASQATGKYLVLLNSDVFAKTKGWALKMAEFYQNKSKIGVLGAKLLYEDGSLQHAGMFFAQTTFSFWLTLHYYKGLPGNYAPAQQTRPVPAVTGACLMIRKELYDEVGGLTTDYVIGDFEDSDLCFKCRALGYESWYFADTTLYHLERQSVPLNNSYNGSLAWQLNGRLHQERWGKEIAMVMQKLTTNHK